MNSVGGHSSEATVLKLELIPYKFISFTKNISGMFDQKKNSGISFFNLYSLMHELYILTFSLNLYIWIIIPSNLVTVTLPFFNLRSFKARF